MPNDNETDRAVTVRLTPAQHRLLYDILAWAAQDVQEGIEDSQWALIIPEEEWEDAPAAVAALGDAVGAALAPEDR